jgi:hypothetical protein
MMPASLSCAAKALTVAALERVRPEAGNGLNGIKLNLQGTASPRSRLGLTNWLRDQSYLLV